MLISNSYWVSHFKCSILVNSSLNDLLGSNLMTSLKSIELEGGWQTTWDTRSCSNHKSIYGVVFEVINATINISSTWTYVCYKLYPYQKSISLFVCVNWNHALVHSFIVPSSKWMLRYGWSIYPKSCYNESNIEMDVWED